MTVEIVSRRNTVPSAYPQFISDIQGLLNKARYQVARSINSILTTTYWEIGRRIVEFEQNGMVRANYGIGLMSRLSRDLTKRLGRGFSERNLIQMRSFYLQWPIPQTVSAESLSRVPSFPLSWSHYTTLLGLEDESALSFYHSEAIKGGWSVRQLERQINTQFYERSVLSRKKSGVLKRGRKVQPEDVVSAEQEIKNPLVLEFLNLKDEYSESDLEEALVKHLEAFLLELGRDFAFVARQKRLRIGDEWCRVDLVLFHRRLRCLVLVDLKLGKFSHSDAGQMHMYLNYAREKWTNDDENPPVGLILCARKNESVAHYALGGLPNKILAATYKTALPSEKQLVQEMKRTQISFRDRIVGDRK